MFEAVFWVSEVIVASMAGSVVSVDNCWSGGGCTGFKSCSISVEVIGVSSGVTSDSGWGGGGEGESLRAIHGHMANLFTQITGYGRTFSARISELGALTAYRLLVVVYYSAPLIANLEGIVDGGLVEDHMDKSVPIFQANKVVIHFVFQANHLSFNISVRYKGFD